MALKHSKANKVEPAARKALSKMQSSPFSYFSHIITSQLSNVQFNLSTFIEKVTQCVMREGIMLKINSLPSFARALAVSRFLTGGKISLTTTVIE